MKVGQIILRVGLLFILALIASSPASAEVLKGRLIQNGSEQPVANFPLYVTSRHVQQEVTTDENGYFSVNLRRGSYSIISGIITITTVSYKVSPSGVKLRLRGSLSKHKSARAKAKLKSQGKAKTGKHKTFILSRHCLTNHGFVSCD